MPTIKIDRFFGEAPRISPRLLDPAQAVTAKDCLLTSGALEPLPGLFATGVNLSKTGTPVTMHLYRPGSSTYWFNWLSDVDVVESGVANDAPRRAYWTGDGDPKFTYSPIAYNSSDYPSQSYLLGLPAPGSAPSVTPVGSQTCNTEDQEARAYKVTYVAKYTDAVGAVFEQESAPSIASPIVTVCPGQQVDISTLTTPPTSGRFANIPNITHKRIYRTDTSNSGTAYLLVAEIPLATATYSDTLTDNQLGGELQTESWLPPPQTLKGLTGMANGIMAGFDGTDVYFCEPYRPYAWPEEYRMPVNYPIVGLGSFGQSLVVVTEAQPYLITGTHPANMSSEELEIDQAGVSKRGIVDFGYGVAYPSPDGMVLVSRNGAQLVTEELVDKKFWKTINPSSIHAYRYDGAYIGFYDDGAGTKGSIIFDPRNPPAALTFSSVYAVAGFHDAYDDTLYLGIDQGAGNQGSLSKWREGANLSYTWRSKTTVVPKPVNMSLLQVEAWGYPVTVDVIGDGVVRYTATVNSSEPVRLPGGYLAKEWAIELRGTNKVNAAYLSTSMSELSRI